VRDVVGGQIGIAQPQVTGIAVGDDLHRADALMAAQVIGDLLQAVPAGIELHHLGAGGDALSSSAESFTRASTNTTLCPGTARAGVAGASDCGWLSLPVAACSVVAGALAAASAVAWLSAWAASATVAATAPSNSMRGSSDMIIGVARVLALVVAGRALTLFHHMLLTRVEY
jgi:hypothetical protein